VRSRGFLARGLVLLGAAVLVLAGCGGPPATPPLVVGGGPTGEATVLAELYAAALRYYGNDAVIRSAPEPLNDLDSGDVAVVPAFTGRVLQRYQPGASQVQDQTVYRAMIAALPDGVVAGDYAMAAQDKPAAVVTERTALGWGGRELTALVRHCGGLSVGTVAGVDPPGQLSGCRLPAPREFPDDTALFDALRAGRIDVAWTTMTDPDVPGELVVLADRRPPLIQAENVVPLYWRDALDERAVRAVNEVAGELDTAALVDMRRRVADGADPKQVAEDWLSAHPLGR